MFSVAGVRLGTIVSNPGVIQYIKNYKPHYTVNCVALLIGDIIVENYETLLNELIEKFNKGKQALLDELVSQNYRYVPTDGCFICIYPKYKSAEEITEKLKEKNILIFCGKGDSAGLLRVTIWDEKYMELFMNALKEIDTE